MEVTESSDNFYTPFHKIMYRVALVLLIFLVPHVTIAQEKPKHWIFFTDKPNALAKNGQVEEGYLTDKALARRALRGESDLKNRFAIQDAPVSRDYENDLLRRGVKIEQRSRWLNAVTARLSEDEVKQIAALPYVRNTRPVALLSANAQTPAPVSSLIPKRVSSNCPSNKYGNSCTQLDIVNAIPAIERGINGDGVTLGFIDNDFGVPGKQPFGHPSLVHIRNDNRLIKVRDFRQRDAAQACSGLDTHGMKVASVAVGYEEGKLIGPGYGATIYAATTECSSYERNIEEDNFVAAVEWLESEGVDVITASIGYFQFDAGQRSYTQNDFDGDTGLTTIAMDWAAQRGIIPISAAGNFGLFGEQTVGTPADGDSVIATGGIFPDGVFYFLGSRGPTADGRTKPDVSAQADNVYSAGDDGYRTSGGTSFSAPMIAGIVTQILQVNPNLGPRDVWHILTSTASKADSPDNNLGWGVVDADAAIRKAATFTTNRLRESLSVPDQLIVHSPYPNPFRDIVHFTITSGEPVTHVRLAMFDVLGREVATVYDGTVRAGEMPVQFDGSRLPSGVYAYRLESEGRTQSGTMILLGY